MMSLTSLSMQTASAAIEMPIAGTIPITPNGHGIAIPHRNTHMIIHTTEVGTDTAVEVKESIITHARARITTIVSQPGILKIPTLGVTALLLAQATLN